MDGASDWLWELDGWIVLAGILCAVSASLVGNFLVLRKASMLGDAISHAVLPGLALAFLATGSRQSLPMFIGAALVGILTAVMTQWIRDSGKVDEGASMGVVFTSLFALGLVLIVRGADTVDLDPSCVLYGAIELTPLDTTRLNTIGFGAIEVPRVVITLGIVTMINLVFVILFFKELQVTSFDPAFAATAGFPSKRVHYLLMTLVAVTAVASFESVGNILVVAMFIVPPAAARLMTDRLPVMIFFSVLIGSLAASVGHWSAVTVPRMFGFSSVSTAGMIAVVSGVIFAMAVVFSPKQGLLVRYFRGLRLELSILRDDVLGFLFRLQEKDPNATATGEQIAGCLHANPLRVRLILFREQRCGHLTSDAGGYRLSASGQQSAVNLVRAHRLWEQYLVDQTGMGNEKIHDHAERFEHIADKRIRDALERETQYPESDPHGTPIPKEFQQRQ